MLKSLTLKSIDFITAGVACNCLTALYEAGLVSKLEKRNFLKKSDVDKCSNPICMHSALVTLERAGIFKEEGKSYHLTSFGKEVLEYLGLVTIFFDGYGQLVSRQSDIVKKRPKNVFRLIKGESVSRASRFISDKTVHPVILEVFSHLKFKGAICDLGCGYGDLLTKICRKTGNPGLGFDSQPLVVKRANRKTPSNITIEKANIANLKGVWEDVVILMQSFVFHDFTPSSMCIKLMNSYLKNFPNLRYFFYVDIVSPSPGHQEIFPGFDYVHGLLGVKTRTYEETIEMFEKTNFTVAKEIKIDKLPNTYLWILDMKR
ncbi:MAG TPA: methyltransferase domain-containing protein [Rhabdochlamydiaceae bacterium]|nr:methyltransferase domain-containing protein [Rhabdochlamydiaceae bacterium]